MGGGLHPTLIPVIVAVALGAVILTVTFAWSLERCRSPPRRRLGLILSTLAALAYAANVYAWLIEPRLLVVRNDVVESAAWRGPPLTIAVIADTHVGSAHVDARRVSGLVTRINVLEPDLVVLLGDYAGGYLPAAERTAADRLDIMLGIAAFARLSAPLGVVAVIGNHDSWYGRADIQAALEDAGVAVLWNRNVIVERAGAAFIVAGLADKDTGDPNIALALAGARSGLPIILATHSPDPFAAITQPVALTLAAHTHCGQVFIPLLGRLVIPSDFGQRFACGRVEENGRTMIVSGGVGVSVLPLRFLSPPEIGLITLRAASPN